MMQRPNGGAGDATVYHRSASAYTVDAPWQFKPAFATPDEWYERANRLRVQAAVALGLWPMPAKTPLTPAITRRIDRDAYNVENVYFASFPGYYVTGNLYRPTRAQAPSPVVMLPYGHWPGGRWIWRSDEDCEREIAIGAERTLPGARAPLQAACVTLARMGCVVFHYDMVGYCDGEDFPHTSGFDDADAVLNCQSTLGLGAWNSVRALDYVCSLPKIDRSRIAITGASGGATQSIALAAVDNRLCASFPMVMVSQAMQGGCVCENAPLYRVDTNNVELALLMAPKPLGMVAADDWTRDFEKRGLPEMRAIYTLLGHPDNVEGRYLPYKHNFNVHSRERLYAFMNERLGLGQSETREQEFEPIGIADLRVFNAESPRPADSAGVDGVRRLWAAASAEAIVEAHVRDDRGETMLRAAFQAATVEPADDRQPAIEVVRSADFRVGNTAATRIDISRAGQQESIPVVTLCPSASADAVVLMLTDAGTRSLGDGRALSDAAQAVLSRGHIVTSIGMFGTDEHPPIPTTIPPDKPNRAYVGFALGFNRSLLANRARDVRTAAAYAHTLASRVAIVAKGEAAIAALLAAAVTQPNTLGRVVMDLDNFDFDDVKRTDDPRILPGASKYGGVATLIELCSRRTATFFGVRQSVLDRLSPETRRACTNESTDLLDLARLALEPR